jgi:sirohydrochlorin cobaltochelatase
MKGLILFGHGARDVRWREPFDNLLKIWQAKYPGIPVEVAFLEMMTPDLHSAVDSLVKKGVNDVTVIPVFFGQGGHLRNDFPVMLEKCRLDFPAIKLSASAAVGEDANVLLSIIDFANRSMV